jgi:catechol 2,3-dioxygenase-like lactoylglutathione lyase family enzyme
MIPCSYPTTEVAGVALPRSVGAITLFIQEVERSRAFYENVFGADPVHADEESVAFRFDNTIVNLVLASAAHELIEPGRVADPHSGSRFQLTIWVKDAEAACAELAQREVELLNGPVDREWGVRTAAFSDPDGHVWEVAQQLPPERG